MNAIVVGADEYALGDALESMGVSVTYVEGFANRPALEDAGIVDCDLFVLTDVSQATSIPVAKDINDQLRVVVYADDSVPEFVRGRSALIIDPDLLSPETVAEELV
ncbi:MULTISPECIES: CTP synthetase [unclassified Haladaptatus]|uniref:DUF7126 family protein n=1 Tax=unclassified Haladaptatus TaxID=2622732 RepID=UPI0023E7E547|nr:MULTISPECIES: CTP synthetase [unclassified Haladaptatus]